MVSQVKPCPQCGKIDRLVLVVDANVVYYYEKQSEDGTPWFSSSYVQELDDEHWECQRCNTDWSYERWT